MSHPPDAPNHLTRRRFLRLGLTLPMLAATIAIPVELLAATLDPIGDLAQRATAPLPPHKPRPPRLLMLDPGHGGFDPGAIGVSGTHEKDVTLDIARTMHEALSDAGDVTCKLTRTDDVFLPLPDRVKFSRDARADLFVSIHADSAPNPMARGLSVYTLSEKASDAFAGDLARQENSVDALGGQPVASTDPEVAAILFDLTARRTRNTAQHAKVDFVRSMGKKWHLLENPMRAANFAVLRSPSIPAILVETGFLSNPKDEAVLSQPLQRQKIAALMARELAALLNSSLFG